MAAAVLFLFTRYRQLLFIHLLLPGVLLAGVGFQPQRTYFEADIGFHMPQAVYDKYADSGLSFRFVYSFVDPHLSFIHYDLGAQFLAFRSESWMESSYLFGPLVDVNNSEQCLGLTFGPRITSPSFQGALRPYIGVKGGMFFFYETITWELEEGPGFWCWIFDTCDDEDYGDSHTEILDARVYPGLILELGTNIYTKNDTGVDFGVQYDVIAGLKGADTIMDDIDQTIGYISRKLIADYVSIYFGVSFLLKD